MVAVGHDRIAIVRAALDPVELVAVLGSHFVDPQLPGAVEGDSERVAVPRRPDLGGGAAAAGERVVARHGAVVVKSDDLAERAVHVLRRGEFLAVAVRDVHLAVGPEGDAVAEMAAAAELWALPPDDLKPLEPGTVAVLDEARPADHRPARLAVAPLDPAQIDQPVLGEAGMEDDIAEPRLAAIIDRRRSGDVADPSRVVPKQLQLALLLGDQRPRTGAGQEDHRPGLFERGDRSDGERPAAPRLAGRGGGGVAADGVARPRGGSGGAARGAERGEEEKGKKAHHELPMRSGRATGGSVTPLPEPAAV
jgi:hypothetical protein